MITPFSKKNNPNKHYFVVSPKNNAELWMKFLVRLIFLTFSKIMVVFRQIYIVFRKTQVHLYITFLINNFVCYLKQNENPVSNFKFIENTQEDRGKGDFLLYYVYLEIILLNLFRSYFFIQHRVAEKQMGLLMQKSPIDSK